MTGNERGYRVLAITAAVLAASLVAVPTAAQSVAITPVTVIDVREGIARPDRTVVVRGDRITSVEPADSVEVPTDARVVDGSGKYLIPGLWDMHTHSGADELTRTIVLPLYVAHGITGIRELSGKPGQLRLRAEIAEGAILGPRMVVGSPMVDGPNPWPAGEHTGQVRVADAGEAREMVDSLWAEGYEFIKTYQFLSPAAYRALHERAGELGMEVSGEIPMSVSLWEAAALGHRTVEHLTGVEFACSRREEELRVKFRRLVAEISADTSLDTHIPVWNRSEWEPVASWDPVKCRALYRHLAAHKTWVVPTIAIQHQISHASDPAIQNDPRQRYLPGGWWDPEGTADWYDPDRRLRPTYDRRVRALPDLHQAGVGIMAGSDMLGGFPLHDELAFYVESGLSPLDALRTATLNPARYLGATDSLGTVEAGKVADLVLLEANPLEDIGHIQEIAAVVLDGRYLDRAALDEILEKAQQAASRPQEIPPDSLSREEESPSGEPRSDTVHVARPTGETEADRASVQAAFDAVQPGGRVLFAPGTYLLGAGVRLTVPDVTVLGHTDGTVLRGCDPEAFEVERADIGRVAFGCTGLYVQAQRQTIRDLTFEYTWHGIVVGPYPTTAEESEALQESGQFVPSAYPAGGQRIEGNTFRATPNGLRVLGSGEERSIVRDNDFVDVFHAIGIYGAPLHFVDNRVTVEDPGRVPSSRHPGSAILVSPGHTDCAGHVIAGNRVEGYPGAIYVLANRGESCRGVEIRDNTIEVRRVKVPEGWIGATPTEGDSTMVGVPITLTSLDRPLPSRPDVETEGVVEEIVIEGNRLLGAEGLGILVDGSRNRISRNTVTGIRRREPFPGVTWIGDEHVTWETANGSGIWVSSGSEHNEIVGNTFEDVAGAAVFLEGDRNRVTLRSAGDSVRDLGADNEVTRAESTEATQRSFWRPLASPDRASARLSRSRDGTLFAGTRAGLFASEDLGRSWRLRGSANRNVGPPLVTPEGALLAGSYRQGVLRSTDGGRTWTSVGFERNVYTGSLVRDRDGRIYASARGAVEEEPTGVVRSDDDGRTWTAAGLADEEVYDVSIPQPGVLVAGTESGLFRSEDGGDTWSPAGELPSGAPVSKVVAHEGDLFAAMGAPLWRIPGGGVARSPDGGATWEPVEGLPAGAAVQDLAVHDGTLFAAVGDLRRDEGRGLYRLDAAGRWLPSGLDDVRLLSLLSTPDGLFAGALDLGVFRSEDGRSWTRRSEGFRNWLVHSLAVGTDGTLYALPQVMDLFRSADRGSTWTSTPRPEDSAVPTPWSMIVSLEGRLLLAGEGGILASEDGGASWERRPIPGEEGEVFALSAGPGGELFAVVRREAAYVSPDEGRSWRRLDLPGAPVQALFSSPAGARFATTSEGFHRRSGDGPWEEVSGEHVWSLTACGEALVAGTYARGLVRSTDDGRSWSPVTEELRARSQQRGYLSFTALACLPDDGVLAGTFWDGVFYSPDAGETWRDATAGLPAESVQDIAVGPRGDVYVSTPAGVFVNVGLPARRP